MFASMLGYANHTRGSSPWKPPCSERLWATSRRPSPIWPSSGALAFNLDRALDAQQQQSKARLA